MGSKLQEIEINLTFSFREIILHKDRIYLKNYEIYTSNKALSNIVHIAKSYFDAYAFN